MGLAVKSTVAVGCSKPFGNHLEGHREGLEGLGAVKLGLKFLPGVQEGTRVAELAGEVWGSCTEFLKSQGGGNPLGGLEFRDGLVVEGWTTGRPGQTAVVGARGCTGVAWTFRAGLEGPGGLV